MKVASTASRKLMTMPIFEREIEQEMRKQQGLLRYSEVAERLGICQRTVYERIKAGKLKSVHYGSNRYVYVSERDLEDYIARLGGQKAMSKQKTKGEGEA